MLKVGIIGAGNAGNQVLVSAKTLMPDVPLFAINCSKQDIATLPKDIKYLVVGDGEGSGKDRTEAKTSLKNSIKDKFLNSDDVKEFMNSIDFLFIVSSTGGGSGSGMSLVLSKIIGKLFPNITVVTIGILPALNEGLSSHVNTLEYLHELYDGFDYNTYLLYDNNKFSHLPINIMMQNINKQIAEDINVLRGYYNFPTVFSSIDDKELRLLLRTSGRLVVSSLYDIKESDIDEGVIQNTMETMLVTNITKAGHVEMQSDKIVNRIAVITNLSQTLFEKFNTSVPQIQKQYGVAVERFEHCKVNDDRKIPNNIFVILAGTTEVNERIIKINETIDKINSLQEEQRDELELDLHDISRLNQKKQNRPVESKEGSVDIGAIFSEFGV